jgi:large subunit ribosomal protein L7/L12
MCEQFNLFYIYNFIQMAELTKNAAKIMDLVKELTIVELNDLVSAMEEEFGVSAAAPVMVAAAGGAEEEGSSTKTVVLTACGASKIAVIKVIREITGLGLKEAKEIADNGGNVKEDASKEDAAEIKTKLEEAGASVELK